MRHKPHFVNQRCPKTLLKLHFVPKSRPNDGAFRLFDVRKLDEDYSKVKIDKESHTRLGVALCKT